MGTTPTAANFLGKGTTQFINGGYVGSFYGQIDTSGVNYISITNALIDSTHPFGSSSIAFTLISPVIISSISDGSIDNTYAIITIPRSFLISLFGWKPSFGVTQLYTFFSSTNDGNNLHNAAGVANIADGPFLIETYINPGDNFYSYRINAIVAFSTAEPLYVYVSDINNIVNHKYEI